MPDHDKRSFENPILPGFYPDPSICRVGEDYYLVTSSFAYFPGIPLFHSRDLVHWKQIGHVLDRPSQLDLDAVEHSEGIFAPTIRFHDGKFYVITTNVTRGGNFIVTADRPEGSWSEPYWLTDAPGIDPSLFFDDDGRCWCVATWEVPEGPAYYGDNEIWMRELDLDTMTLKGERYGLWRGALKHAIWPEAPHIYKKDGYYYLMIAEGGTDFHHSVTIARSRDIKGPYEGCPSNPILTHRHLGRGYPIVNVGHGDLVETQKGEWWMVLLASRPYGGYYRNLGRETFLVPVIWEDGWPVVSPGTGRVEFSYPYPDLPSWEPELPVLVDHFDSGRLDPCWNFLRTSGEEFYSLTERPGYLRLKIRPARLTELANPSLVCRRQQHMSFVTRTVLEFAPDRDEVAGMVLLQSNRYHLRMEYALEGDQTIVRLVQCKDGVETLINTIPWHSDRFEMKISAHGQDFIFYFGDGEKNIPLAQKVDGRILSTDVAGGFVGTTIGLYASGNGRESHNIADFDLFEYRAIL